MTQHEKENQAMMTRLLSRHDYLHIPLPKLQQLDWSQQLIGVNSQMIK